MTSTMKNGNFIISLDFELHWGVAELWNVNERKDYFTAARQGILKVLNLFEKHEVHATWATVGFLFAKNKEQLIAFSPLDKPTYDNSKLSYYSFIENNEIGNDELEDPFHFATSLIEKIIATPYQEIATHTFAHYYCNEKGQTIKQFEADLKAAQNIAKENFNVSLESLVLPRNQFNSTYSAVAAQNGIKVIRTNPDVWFWKSKAKWVSLIRALDTLFAVSKSLTFVKPENNGLLLLPASRFLRPYTTKEKAIQKIKINRIKKEMTFAAINNKCYHLWWHPHNFGYELNENLDYLEEILLHYQELNVQYDFASRSMIEMY